MFYQPPPLTHSGVNQSGRCGILLETRHYECVCFEALAGVDCQEVGGFFLFDWRDGWALGADWLLIGWFVFKPRVQSR